MIFWRSMMRIKPHDPLSQPIKTVPKMPAPTPNVLWCRSGSELACVAADHVEALLARKAGAVIALPTGQTPLGLYAEWVTRAAAKRLSVAQARFFNLDDYLGVSADHPLSYARFLREHFLSPAGVVEEHIRLLRGDAAGIEEECRDYEAAIEAAGAAGVDTALYPVILAPLWASGFSAKQRAELLATRLPFLPIP